ncbi:MAG: SsrA-binding protein [Rhizomicrobium sp.]
MHKREAREARRRDPARGHDAHSAQALFQSEGIAKIELGIAKGKKLHDKRETEKQRDWQRDKARLMRAKG